MTTPKPREVQLVMADALRQISQANGYRTNAGAAVATSSTKLPEGSITVLLQGFDEESGGLAGSNALRCSQRLSVQGAVDGADDDALDAAHALLADIKRAVKLFVPPSGLLRGRPAYRAGRITSMPEDGADLTLVEVDIVVEYDDPG